MTLIDQRKHPRYQVKDGTLAVLSRRGDIFMRLGEIIDISEEGVGLRHMEVEKQLDSSLDLKVVGYEAKGLRIENFPGRLVYEVPESSKGLRCGIRFDGLSGEQLGLWRHFIRFNSVQEC
ncbi:MAG: PilZ domain-containing protein [Syntrophobacteraceae bacterium]